MTSPTASHAATVERLEAAARSLADEVGRYGPRSVPTELRRNHILTVAALAFITDGFDHTSMQRIAEAAGVTKPVVYGLFTSKEDLFAAVVDVASAEMGEAIATATADPSESPLAAGIRAFLTYARDSIELWGPVFASLQHGPVDDAIQRLQRQQVEIVALSISRGHDNAGVTPDPREVEALAHFICGSVQAVARWWNEHRELSIDDVVDFLEAAIAPSLAAIRSDRSATAWFNGGT